MRNVVFSAIILFCAVLALPNKAFAEISWSEIQPGGAIDAPWAASAMSSDGQKIIVGHQTGGLYLSSNRGSTWTSIDPSGGLPDQNWYTASMSANGQIIIVGSFGFRLYKSIDGGATWSETQPAGDDDLFWYTTSMSSDGQIMLAGIRGGDGKLYKSLDTGNTWSEVQPSGVTDKWWVTTNMSANGQVMIAGIWNERVYRSRNAGLSWTEIQPAGDIDQSWYSVGISAAGDVMLVGSNDRTYLSTNGGDTWAETQPAGDAAKYWQISDIATDGNTLFTGGGDRLYLSTDQAATWSQTQPAGNVDRNWTLGQASPDNKTFLAGVYEGRIYLGLVPPSTDPVTSNRVPNHITCATTPIDSPNLFQINTSKNSATLYFSPVRDAQNYLISYGFTPEANQYNVFTNRSASPGVISYTINALPPNSALYFKVFAQNNCGEGKWSNVMQVSTTTRTYYKNIISQLTSILPKQTSTPTTIPPACQTYLVKPGDSLWQIASEHLGNGVLYTTLLQLNNLSSTVLFPGQSLKIGC